MTDIPEDEILLARMHAAYQQSFVGQMPTEEMKAELRAEGKLYGRLLCYLADRAAQAERMARLERKLRACQWYWPEDDTSSEACADSAQEVVQSAYEYDIPTGDIIAVARGGVVDVAYCAYLPPADDSDSDDDFWVEEETREAAKKKIDAELARRALSQEGSDANR